MRMEASRARKEALRGKQTISATLDLMEIEEGEKPEIVVVRPRSDENQRLLSQGGLFTRAPLQISIDEWVKTHFTENHGTFVLVKFLIPNKDREIALRMLNRMNINHATLFPDLYGASRYCNTVLQIASY